MDRRRGYLDLILAMDGSAGIKNLLDGAAFTMTGTPTTGTVLGVDAPTISATQYTSCKIATPFAAGQALSILCVVSSAWAGNDGVTHYLFDNDGTGTSALQVLKASDNKLYVQTIDATPATKYMGGSVSATWLANVNNIVIATLSAANIQQIFLNGASLTAAGGGAGGREATINANTTIGSLTNGTSPLTGSILTAIWGRVLDTKEIAELSLLKYWLDIMPSRCGRSKALYGG